MALKRYVHGAEGESSSRSARRPAGRTGSTWRAAVPVGADRGGDRRPRRCPARVGREPRLHRPEPAPRPRRGSRAPGRAAGRSRSRSRRRMGRSCGDVAAVTDEVLSERGLVGWPKTSGSRGIHVYVRHRRRGGRSRRCARAALALAREVERRVPALATSTWWKEERHGVFIDYNQNAKDRTVASAYSVRPTPDARVSAPLAWDELAVCDPADFTLRTMPARFAAARRRGRGDRRARRARSTPLLELAARQRADGMGDAPWPPHYAKGEDEPPRVAALAAQGDPRAPGEGAAREWSRRPAAARRRPRRARALAGCATPRPPGASSADDVLVDAMRGRFTTWTRVRVNLRHVPEPERPPSGGARPRLRPVGGRDAEDARQLVGGGLLELGVGAVPRAIGRVATARSVSRAGSDPPAGGRRRPRTPARPAAAPRRGPCPGSTGSRRPACGAPELPPPPTPPSPATGDPPRRRRGAARARSRAPCDARP